MAGGLGASALALALAGPAAAEDFVIPVPLGLTNGGATLDGGDRIVVTATGSVTTSGDDQAGLSATGDANALTNAGAVTTAGARAAGLAAFGNGNVLTNDGAVGTSGLVSGGLVAFGAGNALANNGTVGTGADLADGVWAEGDGNTLINDGTVTTAGGTAHGFVASGNGNTVANHGTVTTLGPESLGLRVQGDGNAASNNGIVSTGGGFSYGIAVRGDGNALTNDGTVTTGGFTAYGLVAAGDGNVLANDGTVLTSGRFATGLLAFGVGNTLVNDGTVGTSGSGAFGVFVLGEDSLLANHGTVATTGPGAFGLYAQGDGHTIVNRGTVLAGGTLSVRMVGPGATLRLRRGSVLQGGVSFADPGFATLDFGPGLNAVVGLDGVPATIRAAGALAVGPASAHVAEPADLALGDDVAAGLARLALDAPPGGEGPWAAAAASGGEDALLALATGGTRLGDLAVFGGLSLARAEGGSDTTADWTGLHGGVARDFGGAEAALAAGLLWGEATRIQADTAVEGGLDEATSEARTLWVAPSATWAGVLPMGGDLRLTYVLARHGAQDFDHAGEADVEVAARTSQRLEARLGWSRPGDLGTLTAALDLGLARGGDLDLTLSGVGATGEVPGDGPYARAVLGLDMAPGRVEVAYDSEDRLTLSGAVTWRF